MGRFSDMPRKELAVLENATFEVARAGTGRPPIVLINGGGGPIEGWYRIFRDLAAESSVFAYNRRGIGRSSRPDRPQTSDVVAAELRSLLLATGVTPPWVVVGHSLGGLHANYFARTYPADTAGAVLIEATAPQDPAAMALHASVLQKSFRYLLDRIIPPDRMGEAEQAELSGELVETAGPFPPVPLAVISGNAPSHVRRMPPKAWLTRTAGQASLVCLSPLGRSIAADKSGHFPQLSEPRLVASTINSVVDEARMRLRLVSLEPESSATSLSESG